MRWVSGRLCGLSPGRPCPGEGPRSPYPQPTWTLDGGHTHGLVTRDDGPSGSERIGRGEADTYGVIRSDPM